MNLPAGWVVWSDADRIVWTYRPDVFDSSAYPPACLPTIYIRQGRRDRRPGVEYRPPPDAPWAVTLSLEPEVDRTDDGFPTRAAAIDHARQLAAAFATGKLAYRDLYHSSEDRTAYLEKLDELTGHTM